ncbi:hypothetical protein [Enterococcus avium]|uniref:Uncharacterized protein n=1 Tax=Enterococcus avium TaxID=33945 RepID=A0A437UJ77_ENTAV|nr:hypothetical protein [Enterococcus avium]RVU93680.1 hypothetical protein EK398_01710 [Enterococcus avium]
MSRKEALQIGRIIADRWWHHNESTILAKQNIERRKAWEQKSSLRLQANSEHVKFIFKETIPCLIMIKQYQILIIMFLRMLIRL